MHSGRFVFSQLMEHLPPKVFRRCVRRYRGDRHVQSFTCLDQFLCLAFAQLTHRESLRDIEVCLRAHCGKLYHMGIRGGMARNTLANANRKRDWRIHADFAQALIRIARSTPPPSTCACPCFPGPCSAPPSPASSCTRCWTCAAISPHLSTFPRPNCTTSTCSTCWCPNPARSMSWTGGTWTSSVCFCFTAWGRSSSCGPSPTSNSGAGTPPPRTSPRACAATKPSC